MRGSIVHLPTGHASFVSKSADSVTGFENARGHLLSAKFEVLHSLRSRICHRKSSQRQVSEILTEGDGRSSGERQGNGGERCLWRIHSMECMRRKVLAGMAWPLLMSAMGRQAVTASELQEDPILGALVAALDARDMLASLRTSLTKAKSNLGFSGDLETHLRTLNRIYERLEINLPGMVEELEVDKEIVEQLLECLAYARTDLFNQGLLFLTEGQKSGTPRNNLDGSLQLLKLAINQVDLLLQQVPLELVESAQLARGVRPMA